MELESRIRHFLRLIHTVRYLRPVQIYGRLWYRLYRPRLGQGPIPSIRPSEATMVPLPARSVSLVGPQRLRFLNREGEVARPEDWNASDRDKLWLYNLHYFDDLNAREAQGREAWHKALLGRWVAENPPTVGNGWEPYPTSLRIVNWIKWARAGHALSKGGTDSLALQVRRLKQRLEWHLLGNHLWANAKALVFAGLYFEGDDEPRAWLAEGLRILERELPEQVLADGGHFERSPMYHAIILEDLLDLVNLATVYPGVIDEGVVNGWCSRVPHMLGWLQTMCHPDGEIGFFNDAALGIASAPSELADYAARLGLSAGEPPGTGVRHLAASGYARVTSGPATALLDMAPVGPDYLPGHAHADTLSFELSLDGRRLLVNSGISVYGSGPERQHQRGTLAHNTVTIDGADSSEVWDGFRVARRARPFDIHIHEKEQTIDVSAAHDGYLRLPGRPVHRRQWQFRPDEMRVLDGIKGRFGRAVARYHFHPDVRLTLGANGTGTIQMEGREVARVAVSGGAAALVDATYHPEFGLSVPNQCLQVAFQAPECSVTFTWS